MKMRLKYLGTGASEGWPAIFCECESCKKAMEKGGRNIRTRSQAVVDDKLLIDFPADTYMHVLYQGLDLSRIKNCIITHDHGDHLYSAEFENRQEGYVHIQSEPLLTVYGTGPVGKRVTEIMDLYNLNQEGRVAFKRITPFVPFKVDEYEITPLKADHDPLCEPVFYIISDGKKSILYANDTGYFPDETWQYLEEHRPYFDFVSLDCTMGVEEQRRGHMGISTDLEVRKRLIDMSCAGDNTIFCLHHFTHNSKLIYDELVPIAREYGFLVSYDGMTVEI